MEFVNHTSVANLPICINFAGGHGKGVKKNYNKITSIFIYKCRKQLLTINKNNYISGIGFTVQL